MSEAPIFTVADVPINLLILDLIFVCNTEPTWNFLHKDLHQLSFLLISTETLHLPSQSKLLTKVDTLEDFLQVTSLTTCSMPKVRLKVLISFSTPSSDVGKESLQ